MRSTFKQLYYINRNKVKADGTTAVWCRISIDGKQAVLSTGIYCRPDDWNGKKGEVKDIRTNGRLSQYCQHIENTYDIILKEQGVISAELLKNTIIAESFLPTTLLETGRQELEQLEKRSVKIESRSTYRQSVIFQDTIRRYIESVYDMPDIPLEDVTEQFGRDYKTFLLRDLGCSTDKMNKCLCWLNRLLYLAVDREILPSTVETYQPQRTETADGDTVRGQEDGTCTADVHLFELHRLGVCGRVQALSASCRGDGGRQEVYPSKEGQDQRGSVCPVASRGGTYIVVLQHDRRHEARVPLAHP